MPPKLKGSALFQNIRAITEEIFSVIERDMIFNETKFSARNAKIEPRSPDGVIYRNVFFSHVEQRRRAGARYGPVAPSLKEEADTLVEIRNQYEKDKVKIRQGLALLLNKARTKQDMRDALPDFIVSRIPDFNGIERTREEAWTLLDSPIQKEQYMKIRDTLEYRVIFKILC